MPSPPGKGRNVRLTSQIWPFLRILHDCTHMAGNGHPSPSPADFHPAVLSHRLRVCASYNITVTVSLENQGFV